MLALIDVPDWLVVADIERAGHGVDHLPLRAWNAAEQAVCAIIGDEDRFTRLGLIHG